MGLLDEMKPILRVTSDAFDSEIELLIRSAVADMRRVGIVESYLEPEDNNYPPLVKSAIACYCKARFGYDNDEADRFDASYRQIVTDLLNSSSNVAAIEQTGENCE